MGLITGLLTLPLAPVRGTAWIAEQIRNQALAEQDQEPMVFAQLRELDELHERGGIDDEHLVAAQDALLDLLIATRAPMEGSRHG